MSIRAPELPLAGRSRVGAWPRRAAFVVLLSTAPLLPHLSSDGFDFPAVTNFWVCLPFCALFLLPLIDLRTPRRILHLDLIVLLSFLIALGLERPGRVWPVVLIYPPLIYLGVRMIAIAHIGSAKQAASPAPPRVLLPRTWLVIAIVVLVGVHVSWALGGSTNTDVARGGVQGALRLMRGKPLYRAPAAHSEEDPHTDTYGPANYEAYLPFVSLTGGRTAARLTTLFFELMTALMLFLLGRQIRGPGAGVLLAYLWLAFPLTLYEEAFAFNDAIVAAAVLGAVLVARAPVARGVIVAVAGWTKLSPLALIPLLAGQPPTPGRSVRRGLLEFGAAFALASALIFIPVLTHDSLATFVSRTFGFQAHRTPADSIWAFLQGEYLHTSWVAVTSRIVHGLLVALTGAFALALFRAPRRQDAVGLACASAAVLIALQICLSYYAYSYILWFAPLVLAALILRYLPSATPAPPSGAASEQRDYRSPARHHRIRLPGGARAAGSAVPQRMSS